MNDRFFVDTNVFVYALEPAEPRKQRLAEDLIRAAITTHKGVVSYQVVQEFFSVVLRLFAQPMNLMEAEQYLVTTFRPLLAVHYSYSLYGQALELTRRHSLSWYDSLIVAAALEADCRILFTEDLQHGQKFDNLRVQDPFL
jgi:predicted nucleic acid-binding protein